MMRRYDWLHQSRSWFLLGILLGGLWQAAPAVAADAPYVEEARGYLKQGQVNAAVIQLKNALQANPNDAQARLLLGQIQVQQGDGAGAEKELRRARELGLPRTDWLLPLGKALLYQGQARKVLDEIKVETDDPPALRADVFTLRGQAALVLGQAAEARTHFDEALKVQPDQAGARVGLAQLAMAEKNFADAATQIDTAIKANPNSPEAWLMRAEIERQQKHPAEAIKAFQKVLELQPNNLLGRLGYADSLATQGELDKALSETEKVLKVQPHLPLALFLQGRILLQKKDLTRGRDALQQVQRQAPDHLPTRLLLGMLDYTEGQLQQAKSHLEHVINRQPENLPARKLLAATEMKLKNPQRAVELLNAAGAQMDQDPQLLALLGSAYMQLQDYDKGGDYLQKAADLAPDASAIRTQLALSHLATGQTAEAVSELETAVDLGQGLMQADVLLILAHLKQKQVDEAVQAARNLATRLPDNPLSFNLLGIAYMAKQDDVQARQAFEQALKLQPGFAGAELNLAQLDLKAGNRDAARRRYQSLLDRDPANVSAIAALAQLAGQEGKPAEVLKILEKGWEQNTKSVNIGVNLAQQYLDRNDRIKALNVLRTLSNNTPDNPMVVRAMSLTLLADGKNEEALTQLRRLTELQPQSPEPWLLIAQVQSKQQNDKGVREAIDRSLAVQPDYVPALRAKMQLLFKDKRYQEALDLARGLQQKFPKQALGFQFEGDIAMVQQQYAKAATAYQTAYGIEASAALAGGLARAQQAAGEQEGARATLAKWLAAHPDDAATRLQLAVYLEQAKQIAPAIAEYERIIAAQPNNAVVLNNLALLYQTQGDGRALKYAERAAELAQNQPEVIDTLGWILIQNNQMPRGLNLLKQAAVQAPHLPEIRYHLAVAYQKAGQIEEARSELEKLLKTSPNFDQAPQAKALLDSLKK